MTTTITINAHPVAPNNSVEVTVTQETSANMPPMTYLIASGANVSMAIYGDMTMSVRECATIAILPASPAPTVDAA
jgi:hypothetical protein